MQQFVAGLFSTPAQPLQPNSTHRRCKVRKSKVPSKPWMPMELVLNSGFCTINQNRWYLLAPGFPDSAKITWEHAKYFCHMWMHDQWMSQWASAPTTQAEVRHMPRPGKHDAWRLLDWLDETAMFGLRTGHLLSALILTKSIHNGIQPVGIVVACPRPLCICSGTEKSLQPSLDSPPGVRLEIKWFVLCCYRTLRTHDTQVPKYHRQDKTRWMKSSLSKVPSRTDTLFTTGWVEDTHV